MIPSALSITQASEAGTIYRTDEIAALCEIAHARSLAVHMDGARFANALVRLNATPAQMTWRSGIDVLSFGATKGGALAAEAVVIFDPARAAFLGERRKRAGHLLSKHRFIAAQISGLSGRTTAGSRWPATPMPWPTGWRRSSLRSDCGRFGRSRPISIFAVLPRALDAKLKAAGANYYVRTGESLVIGADNVLVRWLRLSAPEEDEIERFVNLCKNS